MNLNPNDETANYLWTKYTKDMKKLHLGETKIFPWLNFCLSTKPFYFLVKFSPFGKTNILSWLNFYLSTKPFIFLN